MTSIVYNACFGGFSLSRKAGEWLKDHGMDIELPKDEGGDIYVYDIPRHDPLLVECVETLGRQASGSCANLQVKTIDSDKYRIQEYDGSEWVETPDNIKWIQL